MVASNIVARSQNIGNMRIGFTTFRYSPFYFFILLAFFANVFSASAQDTWPLQRCIEYARTNSLTLKQAEFVIARARLADKQNVLSRLPNVSANSNAGWQFGRTIDPRRRG